MLSVWKLW